MAIEKNNDKMKVLDAVLLQIDKQYGKGSIMRLGDEAGSTEIDVIPTGCLALDIALGVGGLPRGRIIEIYGPESSGKTTVALHAIAEAQKMGGVAAFIDAEHALDPVYAKKLGGGYYRNRLRCGTHAESGNRRGYGGFARWFAGKTDVAGVEKADGYRQ